MERGAAGRWMSVRKRLWKKLQRRRGKLGVQVNHQLGSTDIGNADPPDYYQTNPKLASAYSLHKHSFNHALGKGGAEETRRCWAERRGGGLDLDRLTHCKVMVTCCKNSLQKNALPQKNPTTQEQTKQPNTFSLY